MKSAVLALALSTAALLPGAALAQGLAAADLWQSWQARVASLGGTLSADETREGNRITLDKVVLETGGHGRVQIPGLVLVSQADGSVGVQLPERFAMQVTLPETPEAGDPERLFLTVAAPGLAISVLGLGQTADFQAKAPSVSVTLDRMEPAPAATGRIEADLALADLDLHYKQDLTAAVPTLDTAISLGTVHAELRGNAPADGAEVTVILDSSALSGTMAWAIPPETFPLLEAMDNADGTSHPGAGALLGLLDKGLFFKTGLTLGPTVLSVDGAEGEGGPVSAKFTLGGGDAGASIDRSALSGQAALRNLDMAVDGEAAALDTIGTIGVDEYRVGVSLELNGLRGAQPWTMAYVLRNLSMSENFWAKTDPTGAMPRDPITMALDLKGEYAIRPEALAPGWTPATPEELPITLLTLASNEIAVAGLGLAITGMTDLRFDFADMVTYPGMPAPAGRMSFAATGINGLIERLLAMGQITPDDATSARMGLLAFTKAGDAPDKLTTDLDFRDKSFYLNGQKIR